MEAISAAGNFTDFASKSDIEILRANGDRVKVVGKAILEGKGKDVPVYPGDTVHVGRGVPLIVGCSEPERPVN